MKTTKEMIEVMKAFDEGKEIEYKLYCEDKWQKVWANENYAFNFEKYDYRIKFEKLKVYTSLNADELKVGSKVYVGNDLQEIEMKIKNNNEPSIILGVLNNDKESRFIAGKDGYGSYAWKLAYLIKESAEPKTRPMTFEEIISYWKEHKAEIFTYNGDYCKRIGYINGYVTRNNDICITDLCINYKDFVEHTTKEDGSKFEITIEED